MDDIYVQRITVRHCNIILLLVEDQVTNPYISVTDVQSPH